ncbi:hypothetical protein SAMN06265338_14017 [Rhodoblastus acidophilus]|uniref:Uncharacterized protein n=1 Tax=Rhodoblastus acidophilus TaxID=1074 RepID=A0A212SGY0_RHOAC|nr:hypothetical protein SAMN06265338_14017 [Rhodoblastus acidophilus]
MTLISKHASSPSAPGREPEGRVRAVVGPDGRLAPYFILEVEDGFWAARSVAPTQEVSSAREQQSDLIRRDWTTFCLECLICRASLLVGRVQQFLFQRVQRRKIKAGTQQQRPDGVHEGRGDA